VQVSNKLKGGNNEEEKSASHESMSTAEMFRMMKAGTVFRTIEYLPDSECRKFLDMRAQSNLDVTGHPFRHMAADGTVVKLQKPSSFV
jgi:hypothetical protein